MASVCKAVAGNASTIVQPQTPNTVHAIKQHRPLNKVKIILNLNEIFSIKYTNTPIHRASAELPI